MAGVCAAGVWQEYVCAAGVWQEYVWQRKLDHVIAWNEEEKERGRGQVSIPALRAHPSDLKLPAGPHLLQIPPTAPSSTTLGTSL
jgi:hypothetical protein